MSTLEKAISIAMEAHAHQKDKFGEPYVAHVFRVMNMGRSPEEKIVGVLHDVVEDSSITFNDLRNIGFSEEVMAALECLTKRSEDENYDLFIERVKTNPLAMRVKLNDLIDNMDIRRMHEIGEKDRIRLNKYLNAYRIILSSI